MLNHPSFPQLLPITDDIASRLYKIADLLDNDTLTSLLRSPKFAEKLKSEKKLVISWSALIYDDKASITDYMDVHIDKMNSKNIYDQTFLDYMTFQYLQSIHGLQEIKGTEWINNQLRIPIMKRKLTEMLKHQSFPELKKSVTDDIAKRLYKIANLLDTRDEDKTLTNLLQNALKPSAQEAGSKHIVKSYKSTDTKITFTKAGKTVTRVVYVNKRGTKAVKYNNKMVHVSKLNVVV
jgi:hypothetical protein